MEQQMLEIIILTFDLSNNIFYTVGKLIYLEQPFVSFSFIIFHFKSFPHRWLNLFAIIFEKEILEAIQTNIYKSSYLMNIRNSHLKKNHLEFITNIEMRL